MEDQHTPEQHSDPSEGVSGVDGSRGEVSGGSGDGFVPITSQQQLDEVIAEHIGSLREQLAAFNALEEQHNVLEVKLASVCDELAGEREAKTSVEQQLEIQQQLVNEAQASQLRGQIAHKEGLPFPLVKYVQGTTADEITASVCELQGAVDGARRAPISGVGQIVQPVSGLEDENYVRSMLLGALR